MLRFAGTLAKRSISLAVCALSHSTFIDASIKANYDLAVPVLVSSLTTLEVQESLPVLKLKTKGSQTLKFGLQGLGDIDNPASSRLPADVRLTVNDLAMHLSVNGKELTFKTKGDTASAPLQHLSKLIGRPLNLRIDAQGRIVSGIDTLESIFRELPALKLLDVPDIFGSQLQHLFAIYDREIVVGDIIPFGSHSEQPEALVMTCEITAIDDDEIKGIVKGKFAPAASSFTVKGEGGPSTVKMQLTGDISGSVSWNRRNALLGTMRSDYRYQAKLGMGDTEWVMLMTMNNDITVSPNAVPFKRNHK